mgnify:CR=1 FL=1
MSGTAAIAVDTGVPGVRAAFTTRAGGVSAKGHASLNIGAATGDDAGAVRRNRAIVARDLGFDAARAVVLAQVHGADVVHVGQIGRAHV